MSTRVDMCDNCHAPLEDGSRFALGRTWCPRCWRGRKPPTPQPVTEEGRAAIAAWIRPRPAQQVLDFGREAKRG